MNKKIKLESRKNKVTAEDLYEMMMYEKKRNERLKKMVRKQRMLNRGRELLHEDKDE